MWSQLQPTAPHLTYMILSSFLILYALFSQFIRNTLHLSEPPLAVLVGIVLGPGVSDIITPRIWGLDDVTLQEVTRIIVGVQCFAVGIELPKLYFHRHWRSVALMLGPVMAFSWAITAVLAYLIFQTAVPTAMIIGACLSPTDPVLAASVLAKSRFSDRVPRRLKNASHLNASHDYKSNQEQLLAAESACNDGVSFPFLYAGLVIYTQSTLGEAIKDWFLVTILWQCTVGLVLGLLIGQVANLILRFSEDRDYVGRASFIVFYFLLAILSIGVGSTLGSDDFLVAFGAGVGFAHDGWFAAKTKTARFPIIIDLLLNSAMFVYFGSIIPWRLLKSRDITPHFGLGQLFLFLVLVLLFRRIPILLAMKRFIPDIKTYREALFCGHFGPMGLGALFLAMESRAQLETGTAMPLPDPPVYKKPYSENAKAIELIWPVICFVVLGSIMIHGLSVAAISVGGHYGRKDDERAPLIGQETEGLRGMEHGNDGSDDSDPGINIEESDEGE